MNGHPGVASRYNPVIRVFYQRLLAAGKPKKRGRGSKTQ